MCYLINISIFGTRDYRVTSSQDGDILLYRCFVPALLPREQAELMPQARFQLCLTGEGSFQFLLVTIGHRRMKKMQHPGNDNSSKSTGPKKKQTQCSEEAKQAIYRHRTVDTVWFPRELQEMRSKSTSAFNQSYHQTSHQKQRNSKIQEHHFQAYLMNDWFYVKRQLGLELFIFAKERNPTAA